MRAIKVFDPNNGLFPEVIGTVYLVIHLLYLL